MYNNSYDDTYFVTRFVAGLKDEIKKVIVLHRPKYADTASAFTLLQEEELHRSRSKGFSKDYARTSFRSLPDKPRSSDGETSRQVVQKSKTDDKLATLKEFRRINGLCFKYGEKWSHNHKCLAQVSLHVIEELLDALEDTESEAEADDSSETE
jgi:ribosomal protein L7/L12